MNCTSCGLEVIVGKVRLLKTPWRFLFNWLQSHPRVAFTDSAGGRVTLLNAANQRSAYFCPRCHRVIVAPRVGPRLRWRR